MIGRRESPENSFGTDINTSTRREVLKNVPAAVAGLATFVGVSGVAYFLSGGRISQEDGGVPISNSLATFGPEPVRLPAAELPDLTLDLPKGTPPPTQNMTTEE